MNLINAWKWTIENYQNVFVTIGSVVLLAESITRLTPTKTDDGFIKRVGIIVDKTFDVFKFPNIHSRAFKKKQKGLSNDSEVDLKP